MSFLQPEYPLRLDADRSNAPRRAGFQNAIPQPDAAMLRRVDFVAEFTDETSPERDDRNAGNRSAANAEIGKGTRAEVDAVPEAGQNVAGRGARHTDAAPGAGQIREIDVQPPLGIPVQQGAKHPFGAPRGCGDVEVVLVQTADNTVLDDEPGFVSHQRIAKRCHALAGVGRRIDPVQEFRGVGAACRDPAQRGYVDGAGTLANGPNFPLHGIVAFVLPAVVRGTIPVAHLKKLRTGFDMTLVDAAAQCRVVAAAGTVGQRLRRQWRTRGGDPGLREATPGSGCDQARGCELLTAAPGRAPCRRSSTA